MVSTLPENEKRNFGKVRLWGEIGNGVSSSTMMYVVNKFDHGFDVSKYNLFHTCDCVFTFV